MTGQLRRRHEEAPESVAVGNRYRHRRLLGRLLAAPA
jgi:hypothetical protein